MPQVMWKLAHHSYCMLCCQDGPFCLSFSFGTSHRSEVQLWMRETWSQILILLISLHICENVWETKFVDAFRLMTLDRSCIPCLHLMCTGTASRRRPTTLKLRSWWMNEWKFAYRCADLQPPTHTHLPTPSGRTAPLALLPGRSAFYFPWIYLLEIFIPQQEWESYSPKLFIFLQICC